HILFWLYFHTLSSSACPFLSSLLRPSLPSLFSFTDTSTTELYTLSLHDALPICNRDRFSTYVKNVIFKYSPFFIILSNINKGGRSEEHTSELQSRFDLVCRLLLETKKIRILS